ncbi:MAG: hypothetical protein LBL58_16720 [Tannerellaceae bacterium]|jgi:hypothetical protein|nr:hypothetical protein [Tannerellaceae bacterium]
MNFLHYITKSRKGREAQRIELEAMKDPFLTDAIEGYDLVKNEDTIKRIEDIRRDIRQKTHKRVSLARTAGIAASLAVCIGIGSYFLLHEDNPLRKENHIAYSLDTVEEASQFQDQDQSISHSLTVPEPTPLSDNTIKGEPKPATGERAYKEYIYENLFLPAFDECGDTKGQVVVAFKVNAKGRPYDLDIKKSLCPTSDLEAIRVVQQGPNWTLGDKITTVTIRF